MGSYFDAEMRLLQETAQEFARAFPEKARLLNLLDVKDRDPYVERLLEGMAFLTAEVKQRIDDDIPELSEALLSHVRPCFLRPFPSCCIMQFTPRPGQLPQALTLPRGTQLSSGSINVPGQGPGALDERVHCRFRTTSEVELQPLRLANFQLDAPVHGRQTARLHFQLDHDVSPDELDLKSLKIYLHGDHSTAMELYHSFTAQIAQVEIVFPGHPHPPFRLGGQETVKPCHLDADQVMIPSSGRDFPGFHLLHEYFCFPEKYLFVAVHHLDRLAWPDDCCEFEILCHLRESLGDDLRLSKDNFRLHCAPAINLFESSSEPIQLHHRQWEYPVIANNNNPASLQVYSVNRVTGAQPRTGLRKNYSSLPQFDHGDHQETYFQVGHRHREGLRPLTYLVTGGALGEEVETLSCDITVFNGNVPRDHLQTGDIRSPGQGFPTNVTACNITRPTPMRLPPQRDDYRMALVTHLSVGYNSLASRDNLRQLLMLYNWSDQPQNRRRIRGVTEIQLKPLHRIHRGALLRGVDIQLKMAERDYLSPADVYLFGTILHHFFTMYVTINAFVQTGSQLSPSKSELIWEPLLGENFLI